MDNNKITICLCSSRQIIDKEKVSEVSAVLRKTGYIVQTEADLCEKAISSSLEMKEIASATVMERDQRYRIYFLRDFRFGTC
jgi:hypothetical protein